MDHSIVKTSIRTMRIWHINKKVATKLVMGLRYRHLWRVAGSALHRCQVARNREAFNKEENILLSALHGVLYKAQNI